MFETVEKKKLPKTDLKPEEVAEMQKARILSSAELVKGGADVDVKGRITAVTEDQKIKAKLEMGEHFFDENQLLKGNLRYHEALLREERELRDKIRLKKEINGSEISVAWDNGYNEYTILFPQATLKGEHVPEGTSNDAIRLGGRDDDAIEVFNYATELANGGTYSVDEIYEETQKYVAKLLRESQE